MPPHVTAHLPVCMHLLGGKIHIFGTRPKVLYSKLLFVPLWHFFSSLKRRKGKATFVRPSSSPFFSRPQPPLSPIFSAQGQFFLNWSSRESTKEPPRADQCVVLMMNRVLLYFLYFDFLLECVNTAREDS